MVSTRFSHRAFRGVKSKEKLGFLWHFSTCLFALKPFPTPLAPNNLNPHMQQHLRWLLSPQELTPAAICLSNSIFCYRVTPDLDQASASWPLQGQSLWLRSIDSTERSIPPACMPHLLATFHKDANKKGKGTDPPLLYPAITTTSSTLRMCWFTTDLYRLEIGLKFQSITWGWCLLPYYTARGKNLRT